MTPQCKNSLKLYSGGEIDKIQRLLDYQDISVKEEMCEVLHCSMENLAKILSEIPDVW